MGQSQTAETQKNRITTNITRDKLHKFQTAII